MKIARIIARLNIGGPAIQTILLTREFPALGHPSLLITGAVPPEEGDMGYLAEAMGVRPVYVEQMSRRLSAFGDFLSFFAIYRLLRCERPDLVHTHTAKAGTLGRLAAFCAGIPTVHTFHGHVFDGYFPHWKTHVFIAMERALGRITRCIIAISPSQRADLVDRYRIAPAAKVSVVRLGFDLYPFRAVAEARSPAPATLRVAWVGRLTAIKDPLLFVAIAAHAEERKLPAMFNLHGDGGMRPQVSVAAAGLPATRFALRGWSRDMAPVYRDTDVLMLTSRNEGTPVAIIEAMAAGCAIVAADVGGVRDLFIGAPATHPGFSVFENGILVSNREPAAFAAALHLLAGDGGLRTRLSVAASRFATANFGSARLVNELLDVYASVLAPAGIRAAAATR